MHLFKSIYAYVRCVRRRDGLYVGGAVKRSAERRGPNSVLIACLMLAPLCAAVDAMGAPDDPLPRTAWTATASAGQTGEFPAKAAIDGDPNTRWSSPFSDPHWLKVDTGSEATLCGFRIRWETAYSSHYRIDVSLDGDEWKTVYETEQGDGRTDYIFIEPVRARYFRITGLKRATGWGHSIWEIDTWGPSGQPRIASDGEGEEHLMTGDRETVWRATETPAHIDIDLRRPMAFGGVRIDWGEEYGTHLDVAVSRDGEEWIETPGIEGGIGKFDVTPMDAVEARYIRMVIRETASGRPAEIRQIGLRGPDEVLNPLMEYQMAAQKSSPGWYPEHLHGRQTYWTVVGLPRDYRVSLLDEYGNVEPMWGGASFMPYVHIDGALQTALDADRIALSLADDYLPIPAVQWEFPDWSLDVEAVTAGTTNDAVTYVRYRLDNESEETRTGMLYLTARPVQINPPWQHGGMSYVETLDYIPEPAPPTVWVNDDYALTSFTPPDAFGSRAFQFGDIVHDLEDGAMPALVDHQDERGLLSGALAYAFALEPGDAFEVVVAFPLHESRRHLREFATLSEELPGGPSAAFDIQRESMRVFWHARLGDVEFELPDRATADTARSQVAYILVNMAGPAIQPGSRNYNRTWIRDGSITAVALMRMGLLRDARDFLEWYAQRVKDDGLVPPILNNDGTIYTGFGSNFEYDSQGQFVYVMMEYYRLTDDRDFLERHFDTLVRALEFQQRLREDTLAPGYMAHKEARERFVGILPKSISHEGYDPPRHSYWDNFWALRGWQDGATAAGLMGRDDLVEWALEQYDLLEEGVKATMRATIEHKGIDYIPGASELGDFDATSTAIGIEPCRISHILPEDLLQNTFQMYYEHLLDRFDPGWTGQYTPYEARSIQALIELGWRDRANVLLDYLLSCRRPPEWNHLGEVVLGGYRVGGYIGDMPHTWVGSDLLNSVRGMLLMERDDTLELLFGVTEDWFADSGDIRLRAMPTHYGTLKLDAAMNGDTLTVTLAGARQGLEQIQLRWPRDTAPAEVFVDGEAWTDYDERMAQLPARAERIVATW